MIHDNYRCDFERDGYLVIPDFCDSQECAGLNAALHSHYAGLNTSADAAIHQTEGLAYLEDFQCDVIPWDPVSEGVTAFTALRESPKLRHLTTRCIGSGYSEASSLVMYSCIGGRGQSWHQDCPADQAGAYNVNRLIYPGDVTAEDGAVIVVPGSHKRGRISNGGHQETITGERVLCPRAGTLVLVHGWCWHRVLPNTSQRPRVSINFRCFPAGAATNVCSVGVYRNGDAYFREQRVEMR
jgi:ectoine hydroxylase-related dioxygenase (phytanoyl-CoA dioxygenase family)